MMKKTLLLATIFMVSCLFCAGGVWGLPWGEVLCVDPDGGAGVDYTDLQSALTYAQTSGTSDLIMVVQGTYTENFTYSSDEDIYLYGGYTSGCASRVVNPTNTVLDGSASGTVLQLTSATDPYFAVDGFTIQHGGSTGLYVNIYNSNSTGDVDSGDIEITNNIITSNTSTSDGGAMLRTTSLNGSSGNVTVVNNVISGNTTTSISWVSGIEASSSSSAGIAGTVTFTNNTITGNINPGGSTIGCAYMNSSGTSGSGIVNCYNNIIRGNTYIDVEVHGNTKNGYNNNYQSIFGNWDYGDDTNIDVDPRLTGSYHLKSSSPCIDAGETSVPTPPGLPSTDFEGDGRTIDGDKDGTAVVDIGADEYVPKGILSFFMLLFD